jgi:hypothetical protein
MAPAAPAKVVQSLAQLRPDGLGRLHWHHVSLQWYYLVTLQLSTRSRCRYAMPCWTREIALPVLEPKPNAVFCDCVSTSTEMHAVATAQGWDGVNEI